MQLSVLTSITSELTVLGSRFIAILSPLDQKEDVDSYLVKTKKDYPKATHYCYAVRFDGYEFCSDDGEPSHSAGLPILNALKSEGLDRCLLIVVRYFGGTKLGLPRLTKSYRDVSKICAKEAQKVEFVPGILAKLQLDYSSFEYWKRLASKSGFEIKDPIFDSKVIFFVMGSDKILLPLLGNLMKEEILSQEDIQIKRRLNDDSSK